MTVSGGGSEEVNGVYEKDASGGGVAKVCLSCSFFSVEVFFLWFL